MKNLIFFLIVFALISCKKNTLKQTNVDGTVKNVVNGEYMPNVPIRLIGSIGGFEFQGAETIATTSTDANGHFTFNFKAKSNQDYYVTIDHNNYDVSSASSYYPAIVNYSEITKGITNIIQLTPATFGWVKLIINGSGINDSIVIKADHISFHSTENVPFYTYFHAAYIESWGYNEYFIGKNIYEYTKYNNGIATQFSDTITVDQGQYYTHEIVF